MIINFETRSEVDLKNSGAWIYSLSPSTEIVCLSVKDGDKKVLTITSNLGNPTEPVGTTFSVDANFIASHEKLYAYNAFFVRNIWNNVLARNNSEIPPLKINQLHCISSLAASFNLPRSLHGALNALEIPSSQTNEGRIAMFKMCRPFKYEDDKPCWLEDGASYRKLLEYSKHKLLDSLKVKDKLGEMHPREQRVWEVDQKINQQGIPLDIACLSNIAKYIKSVKIILDAKMSQLTNNEVESSAQNAVLFEWLTKRGVRLKNLQKTFIKEYLGMHPDLNKTTRMILEIKMLWGEIMASKFNGFLRYCDPYNRARGSLLYHGALTGRWSGQGFQPHNLKRNTLTKEECDNAFWMIEKRDWKAFKNFFNKEPIYLLPGLARGVIKAPKDSYFIMSDYSTIEPYILLWLSYQMETLTQSTDKDIYSIMASDILNKPFDSITSDERRIGKMASIGLGYGMGAKTFAKQCCQYGINMNAKVAANLVLRYRNKYKKVVKLWGELENIVRDLIKKKKGEVELNRLIISIGENILKITLPSGRTLYYHSPSIESNTQKIKYHGKGGANSGQWMEYFTYGSNLVENIVQGISRDILAHALVNLNDAGFKIIFTVHDEIIIESKEEDRNKVVKSIEDLMTTLPTWAEGLPLQCSTVINTRYIK